MFVAVIFLLPLVLGGLFCLRRAYQYLNAPEWLHRQFTNQGKNPDSDREKLGARLNGILYVMLGSGFLSAGVIGLFLIARSL